MSLAVEYLLQKTVCQRCNDKDAVVLVRRENYCSTCFVRFIRGKQRRLMQDEAYKVSYKPTAEPHRVLLALSGGASSLVLLDAVASLLEEQHEQHGGRQGFALTVVNIDENDRQKLNKSFASILELLRKRYSLIDIDFQSIDLDSFVDKQLFHQIEVSPDFASHSFPAEAPAKVSNILDACSSKSSQEDILLIIQNELLLQAASKRKCGTIIYGHSMSRLADEVLALTIKGRGESIHSTVADHQRNYNGQNVTVKYPLRDVLMGEIEAYCKLANLEDYVMRLTIPEPTINKNKTVRALTAQYFRQLDATGYSSTASTVVRTADKLAAPTVGTPLGSCSVCGVEIRQDPHHWLRRITVNEPPSGAVAADFAATEKPTIDVCYGCTVSIGGSDSFRWPKSDADIIAEYTLLSEDE